jgi:hypothetical protein
MNQLSSVEISGNLLSESIIQTLADENTKHRYAKPDSFRWYKYDVVDTSAVHNFRINNAYEQLIARWDLYANQFRDMPIGELRDKWIKYFFQQLGYELKYLHSAQEAGELKFILSHRGWDHDIAPVIHTVLYQQDLDKKTTDGAEKYSPHDNLQRYLINKKEEKWGVVSNGRELRILRDFFHETRKAYIKFDLEMIFEGRSFQDFRLLWRLIHPSRFLPSKDDEQPLLEHLFEESQAAGVAIGEDLRYNVRIAIETLAGGFLHSTPELATLFLEDQGLCKQFHHELLRVVYRVIFLLYAEQRNLMPGASSLYFQEYSISALRKKVESGIIPDDDFTDLWEGLKITFDMVFKGVPELGIPNYNGLLFHPDEIKTLNQYKCHNKALLEAIQYLTTFDKGGILHRISYIELGVDELGSIYESLLDYIPRISDKIEVFEDTVREKGKHKKKDREIAPRTFFLDPRGTSRKTSGSYYTNPQLVNALIDSALKPVLEQKLREAEQNRQSKVDALLSLKVCDPACGSGAFLIAATEFLGLELAKIQTGDDYPSDSAIRHGRRQVLRHCIYGVDINPLSAELAKVSLWLTAATDDQPLNFLDHHIKCGNSLVGATPELIQKGIPAKSYNPVTGDDKTICSERKRIHREYIKQKDKDRLQYTLQYKRYSTDSFVIHEPDLSEHFKENSSAEIDQLKQEYESYRQKDEFRWKKLVADFWTAAFFWRHDNPNKLYPAQHVLDALIDNEYTVLNPDLERQINRLSQEYKFFHWHLEFPEVFEKGGFDCVLGNPPWERIKLQEQEFFAVKDDEIAKAPNKAAREKLIKQLPETNPDLWVEFRKAKFSAESLSRFIRNSERFSLTAVGDINTYAIFAELCRNLINDAGHSGIIVPTGIATDDTCKKFFADINNDNQLFSLYDFENRNALFPGVHRSYKFCLFTLSKCKQSETKYAFFLTKIEHLEDEQRRFTLSPDNIKLINPNTMTTPVFRTRADAELTKMIYQKVPVLVNEKTGENPWGIWIRQGLYHMTNDNNAGYIKEKIEHNFIQPFDLVEAKMIWQYDHHYAYYNGKDFIPRENEIKIDSEMTSQYVVEKEEFKERLMRQNWKEKWMFCFRNITNATNERTIIATITPIIAPVFSFRNLFSNKFTIELFLLLSNLNSIILDFIVRQKIGGTNLSDYITKQLSIFLPDFYTQKIIDFIKPRVLELVYTAYDLKPFAEDMGYDGPPFKWDEDRRAVLKAELDAYYAKLYGLNRKQLRYILDPADLTESELRNILDPYEEVDNPLDEEGYKKRREASTFPGETFRVLKQKEIRKFGEYRTRRLVLEAWERL